MKEEPRKIITIPQWQRIPGLIHGFGTREWKRSNFGKHPELKKFKLISLHQIHSDIVHVITGVSTRKKSGDAMLTDRSGILLAIKTADCLPVLMADKDGKAIAAAHCGWRSTGQRLVQKVVEGLRKNFGCDPSSLLVAFGPSIGGNCYEVGAEVKEEFGKTGLEGKAFRAHPFRRTKFLLDLQLSNRLQLLEKGVEDSNIFVVDICTHCDKGFLSYRRDREAKSRMFSFIGRVS
jgi:YfiH family protein